MSLNDRAIEIWTKRLGCKQTGAHTHNHTYKKNWIKANNITKLNKQMIKRVKELGRNLKIFRAETNNSNQKKNCWKWNLMKISLCVEDVTEQNKKKHINEEEKNWWKLSRRFSNTITNDMRFQAKCISSVHRCYCYHSCCCRRRRCQSVTLPFFLLRSCIICVCVF